MLATESSLFTREELDNRVGKIQVDRWLDDQNLGEAKEGVVSQLIRDAASVVWSYLPKDFSLVTRSSTDLPFLRVSGTPAADYEFLLTIDGAGRRGVATFSWSSDGGETTAAEDVITGVNVALGSTGISVSFGLNTYGVGSTYSWRAEGDGEPVLVPDYLLKLALDVGQSLVYMRHPESGRFADGQTMLDRANKDLDRFSKQFTGVREVSRVDDEAGVVMSDVTGHRDGWYR